MANNRPFASFYSDVVFFGLREACRLLAYLGPLVLALWPGLAHGQTGLPNPRLFTVAPAGAKAGTTVEVSFTGTDIEEPQSLVCSQPTIKAEPIIPPAPPADPKNPAVKPPPPPVTKFKVTVPAATPPGFYDIRLVNKWGVSNARTFVVGDLREAEEKEPNNDVHEAQRVEINTTINGTIAAPPDVDYFVFAGKKGQRVVISCLTSSIDSRLQAGLELYDKSSRLLAANHNYRDNDALVDCTLPEDGDYFIRLFGFTHLEGSPEHFYRLSITTAPWIDAIFPSVVEPGKPAQVTVYGRNLPDGQLDPTAQVNGRVLEKVTVTIDVPADPAALQRLEFSGHLRPPVSGVDGFEYRIRNASGVSNPFLLAYARAPVVLDNGANDTPETAQGITLPCEIAGRIEKKGDVDWYTFTAKKGEVYSIELQSEKLGAHMDTFFLLRNADAKQDIGEYDDDADTLSPIKFFTRTDDPPRLSFTVPADAKYQLLVSSRDAAVRAGPRHLYRVRITPEQPDFRLVILPSDDDRPDSCRLLRGGQESFTVLAWRLDGWNGTITVTAEGLPDGVTCPPQSMGTGLRQIPLVLSATPAAALGVYPFKVKGTATINGKTVVREARSASITWPLPPGQGIPTVTRLERKLLLAIREQAPYSLAAKLDKETIVQGDKANLAFKLTRIWPDFKTPLQVQAVDLPPNLVINNNQPLAIPADTGAMVVDAQAAVLPGTYTLVFRTTTQIPYNKNPKDAQKPPTNVVLPSIPVTLTILPKVVATVNLPNANVTAKVGAQVEVDVKVARMFDYAGPFKVQLVLPAAIKGLTADEVTIPAGKDEIKLLVKVAADAIPGNRPELVVRATGTVNGTVPVIQEAKLAVNVVK
jgi:hypothetical protein